MTDLAPDRARALRASLLGAAVFVAACALPRFGIFTRDQPADLVLYQRFGERLLGGEIPYRDYFVEYPPGALPAFVLPALGPSGDYVWLFKALMAGCAIAALAALADALVSLRASPLRLYGGVAVAALLPLALGTVVLNRYDLWPTALALAAIALLLRGRDRWSLGLAGVGATAKVFPAVLVPVALVRLDTRGGRRELWRGLATAGAAAVAVLLPFLLLGPGGVRFSAWVQLRRGLQIESLGGSLLAALDRLGVLAIDVVSSDGSHNVAGGIARVVSLLVGLALLGTLAWLAVRLARGGADDATLAAACVAGIVAFVVFGKVLSPQYVIWLLPLAPLLPGRRGALAGALTLGAALLTNEWFPERYRGVVDVGPETWLVVLRNALLVALLAVALSAVAGTQASTPSEKTRT